MYLGGPVPADERLPQAHRLLQSRLHGQRAAACDRDPGQSARPAGRRAVGRRGARYAAWRAHNAAPAASSREGGRLQQQRSGIRRTRDEGSRDRHLRHGPGQPDFAGIARAAGLFGARVEQADQLEDALSEAFEHGGPALVEVRTARQELALPPKLTFGEIKGFTLYATRTILSGRGEELIELARTNVHELDVE